MFRIKNLITIQNSLQIEPFVKSLCVEISSTFLGTPNKGMLFEI